MIPKLELLGISFEVGTVLGYKEEVRRLGGVAVIGERSKLARRYKLP
jgi:hypothetical protein